VRGFDKEYETQLTDRVRTRFGADVDRGSVERFLIQLECRMADGWTQIARSDHNPSAEYGHDATEEGVHVDLYRDGEKVDVRQIGPPMSANTALNRAEEHLIGRSEGHVTRFERWHNIQNRNDR
jgi:hypothetical protein